MPPHSKLADRSRGDDCQMGVRIILRYSRSSRRSVELGVRRHDAALAVRWSI